MAAVVDVNANPRVAYNLLAQVPAWFETWEQALSRFRPDSELMTLNRSAGTRVWVNVSDDLWSALQDALWAAEWSAGLVVPTLLPAMEYIGYSRSFDELRAQPSVWMRIPVSPAPEIVDWRAVELDATKKAVRLPVGAQLDLGGTAKGWAARQTVDRLAAAGPALVDAGGDICVSGARADGEAWPISIADPFTPERDVALLAVCGGCVATSGRDYRRWRLGDAAVHHVIDPRTAWPAETDILTATAVAPEARQAEAAAKSALILGSQTGLDWLESRGIDGLVILEDGRALTTARFDQLIWSENDYVEDGQ